MLLVAESMMWTGRRRSENRKEEQMARAHAHMTEPAAPSGPIHVVVDLNRCQAYAQCCFFAPSVFKLHGVEALWYYPAPHASQRTPAPHAPAPSPAHPLAADPFT